MHRSDAGEGSGDVTRLLRRVEGGDTGAADDLARALQGDLQELARAFMSSGLAGHTLQPTALVNEAWMRVVRPGSSDWEGRVHFLRAAARAMRSVLVDHARRKRADKRGGSRTREGLDGVLAYYQESDIDVVALNEALERLWAMDEQLARIVELRFFAGLTIAETATVLGVSTPTVERGWRVARSWLMREVSGGDDSSRDTELDVE